MCNTTTYMTVRSLNRTSLFGKWSQWSLSCEPPPPAWKRTHLKVRLFVLLPGGKLCEGLWVPFGCEACTLEDKALHITCCSEAAISSTLSQIPPPSATRAGVENMNKKPKGFIQGPWHVLGAYGVAEMYLNSMEWTVSQTSM